jgi:hypothetical protein
VFILGKANIFNIEIGMLFLPIIVRLERRKYLAVPLVHHLLLPDKLDGPVLIPHFL